MSDNATGTDVLNTTNSLLDVKVAEINKKNGSNMLSEGIFYTQYSYYSHKESILYIIELHLLIN